MLIFFSLKGSTPMKIPFFVTTPATNISCILPVYFGDVHDGPQRCKTCQLAEYRGVDPSCLEINVRPLGNHR